MDEPGGEGADEVRLVLTTVPDRETGEALAQRLVEEHLIACANLLPGVTSIYRWKGRVERESELLVLMKTPASRVAEVFGRVAELHPYEVPELIAVPVEAVSAAYAGWVREETTEESA